MPFSVGAGESGKSTIIKQMRIIHSGGFPEDERRQTRAVIYSNLVIAFKVLLDIMRAENIDFQLEKTKVTSSARLSCNFSIASGDRSLSSMCANSARS